jgi:ribosome assembly protein 4
MSISFRASTTAPRIATSSKDGTVRVWSLATRRTEYTLGGHTASVNVVKWGGEGLLYTASSDRTVRVWSAEDVRGPWTFQKTRSLADKLLLSSLLHAHRASSSGS